MTEYERENQREVARESSRSYGDPWSNVEIVLLFLVMGLAFGYGYLEHAKVTMLHTTMNQMQNRLDTLAVKLNEMSAARTAAPPTEPTDTLVYTYPPKAPSAKTVQRAKRATVNSGSPADKSLIQLQAQLNDQQKQLKDTQNEVAETRSDLEGSVDSTRDELNGSIAKTHDELVAFKRIGEREYFEFDLTKSKQFQRSGPLMLSLRKADSKHKSYDLAMIVDDNQIGKKQVDLYEPIWIHAGDDAQPVQVVVNEIDKNHVHGYVSAPLYRQPRPTDPKSTAGNRLATNQNPPQTPQ